MKIGVMVTVTEKSSEIAQLAQRMEVLGFESVWVPEHPIIPVHIHARFPNSADGRVPESYAYWADPFIALTAAAAATTTLKLATGICLPSERDAIVTAKVVASLDLLSKGRVILGVGGGALREETEIMGTKFPLRWKRLRETVEAMKELWTKKEASYQGEFVDFPPVKSYPKPYQKPHPPVLLGAHGPKALARVARYCEGWVPFGVPPEAAREAIATITRLAQEAGRNLQTPDVTIMIPPENESLSLDLIRQYRDAGVNRLVIFSQLLLEGTAEQRQIVAHLEQLASAVEKAQKG